MKPAMYIFVNEALSMSTGKTAAQVAHAAVEAYRLSCPSLPAPVDTYPDSERLLWEGREIVKAWYQGGHYTKLVMAGRDAEHLRTIERYLNDRGFKTSMIIDEGRTEIEPHSVTALGVEIVDKDDPHVSSTFKSFSTLKQPPALPAAGTYDLQKAPRREVYSNVFIN